ncbi:MAG: prepilin-type N-terminal cleavage/methylation domain-containing protein [Pirellulales bacterium]|nr:prepilin-type N-terminal cleavage/methylation domain-containing protein [Pirellulales bacterium]
MSDPSPAYLSIHVPLPFRQPRGFTLLEVLLALGLTAVVLVLVGSAVHTTLRTIDIGRRRTEREQLARAILHRIADDLRAVMRYEPFDDSGLKSSGGRASSGSGGSADSGGSSGQSSGSSKSSSQDSSSPSDNQSQSDETASQTATMPMAGIYGYQDSVQIDITRIPRLDEYLYTNTVTAPQRRGDVRTVTYSVGNSQGGITTAAGTAIGAPPLATNASGGLLRTEADRATFLWQLQGGARAVSQTQTVLASEVTALDFRYFDGAQWVTRWDSTSMNGLPRAVEILIYLADDPSDLRALSVTSIATPKLLPSNPNNLYRMVVHLPAGLPLPAVQPVSEDASQQATSDGSSSTNSSTGTLSGASQNGGRQ